MRFQAAVLPLLYSGRAHVLWLHREQGRPGVVQEAHALFDVLGGVWAKVRAVAFLRFQFPEGPAYGVPVLGDALAGCRLALFQLQFLAPDAQRRQGGAFALGLERFVLLFLTDFDPAPVDGFVLEQARVSCSFQSAHSFVCCLAELGGAWWYDFGGTVKANAQRPVNTVRKGG